MKTYKVHEINEATGKSTLILVTGHQADARKYYNNYKPAKGYQVELSVLYCGSTTLLNWK